MSNFYTISDIFKIKPDPVSKNQGMDGLKAATANVDILADSGYKVIKENWFLSKPYGFRFTPKNNENNAVTMFLPISPNNLTITTNFATNLISTLYGTVEEHSPVRYYDISIEGTTGMAPKYVEPGMNKTYPSRKYGRKNATVDVGIAPNLGGFFQNTLRIINRINNKATELLKNETEKTGLYVDETGYLAFHNLYRFFLKYKKEVSGDNNSTEVRHNHPLTFLNYKDNNQYDVVVKNFTLRRSAENPMLYYYNITLRAYNLKTINEQLNSITNEERLKQLGLNGVDSSTFLSKAKNTANKAKAILGSLGAGINTLGR
jgi:hypothetical protein